MSAEMFDRQVQTYEALVDWPKRLANEEPFYRALFERIGARRALDVACGTGQHAALFHSWGLQVEGADISPQMIDHCRRQYGQSESLRWTVRGFDERPPAGELFDVVICVGNSLSLAPNLEAVEAAVGAMLAAVRPGGAGVIQVLNLWHLPDGPCVWQKCKRVSLAGAEHILVKGVHRAGERGFVNLIDLTLSGEDVAPRYGATMFLGLEAEQLAGLVQRAAARRVHFHGDFRPAPYEREQSPDLIVVAEK